MAYKAAGLKSGLFWVYHTDDDRKEVLSKEYFANAGFPSYTWVFVTAGDGSLIGNIWPDGTLNQMA